MSQKGYIPDIFKIMEKYDLTEYFNNYVKTNTFPSKIRWKHLVKRRIHDKEISSWKTRLSAPEFDRFRLLHTEYSPHVLWISSKENRSYLAASISCVHMIANIVGNPFCNPVSCPKCSTNYDNVVDHCIHDCLFLNLDRSRLWYSIQQLNSDVCTYLRSLDKAFLTMIFLGLDDDIVRFILDDQFQQFRSICMSRIHSM